MTLFNSIKDKFSSKSDSENADAKVKSKLDGVPVKDLEAKLVELRDAGKKARDRHTKWTNFADAMKKCHYLREGLHWEVFGSDLDEDTDKDWYQIENIVNPKIKTQVAILTENRPKYQVEGIGEDNVEFASQMNQVYEKRMDEMRILGWTEELMRKAGTYGTAVTMFLHDKTKNFPDGRDVLRTADALGYFAAPNDIDIPNGKYVGMVVYENRTWVENQFEIKLKKKSYADSIKKEEWVLSAYINSDNNESKEPTIDGKDWKVPVTYMMFNDMEMISYRDVVKETVAGTNGETIEVEKKDEEGNPVYEDQLKEKPKYPNGRLFVLAGDKLIYDQPNPYDHGRNVFMKLDWDKQDDYFIGVGIPLILENPQRALNETLTQIRRNNDFSGDNILLVLEDLLADGFTIEDVKKKGLKVIGVRGRHVSSTKAIEQIPQSALPNAVLEEAGYHVKSSDRQVGSDPQSMGVSKSGDPAIKVQLLDEHTQRLLKPVQKRFEEDVLGPLGWMKMGNDKQFFKSSQMYAISGSDEGMAEELAFDQKLLNAKYNIRIIPGSTLPVYREFLFQWLSQAKQYNLAIPDEILFSYSPVPELVTYAKQWQQQQELQRVITERVYAMIPELEKAAQEVKLREGEMAMNEFAGGVYEAFRNFVAEKYNIDVDAAT